MSRGFSWFTATSLTLGFAFLYLPIVLLVIYSFNASQAGHGLGRLLDRMVRVAARTTSSCWTRPGSRCGWRLLSLDAGPVLGTLAGVALARIGRFRGPHAVRRHDLRAAGHARRDPRPVAAAAVRRLGLARGFWTIVSRTRPSPCATSTVVVQSRLRDLRPQPRGGGHGSGRAAAQDLLRDHPADHRTGPGRRLAAGLHPVARRPGHRQLHHRPRAPRRCRCGSTARCGWA